MPDKIETETVPDRILSDKSDSVSEMHWWVRVIYFFGIPSLGAVVLVWWIMTNVDAKLTIIQNSLTSHQLDAAYLVKANQANEVQTQLIRNLMQQICINTAKSAEDRQNCWNPWRMTQ